MRRGYLLIEALIAVFIAGVVAMIFATINYYNSIQSDILRIESTKQILDVVRSRLITDSNDTESDGYFEFLKPNASDTLPTSMPLRSDAWGREIKYYAQDYGVANSDANYTTNTTSISPNANILAKVISTGPDGVLDTALTDSSAKNDDIMVEIGIGETNHLKLYGGSEISTQTRSYNSAIVSATAPASPTVGLLWVDTSTTRLKVWDGTTWKKVNLN